MIMCSALFLTGALWTRLEAAAAAVAPFRDAALDRWHRKALLAAGGGTQHGSLRALDQAISAQARVLCYLQCCKAAARQSAVVSATLA